MTRYWMAVASREHVLKGVEGGFCQACHGKRSPLARMKPGDWVIYYSSKLKFDEQEPCQKFTAIGQIQEGEPYEFDMGEGFVPFRRDVQFVDCQEVAIRPLIPKLSFITDPARWGYPFRTGFFEITESDFLVISDAMQANTIGRLIPQG
jgi:hypothetical protein